MFKPCAIKEITNPVQANVVRVGGDLFYSIHRDTWLNLSYSNGCISIASYTVTNGFNPQTHIIETYITRWLASYSGGGSGIDDFYDSYRPNVYKRILTYAILRGCDSFQIVDMDDMSVVMQYPE